MKPLIPSASGEKRLSKAEAFAEPREGMVREDLVEAEGEWMAWD